MNSIRLLLLCVFLLGSQTNYAANENSPYFVIPTGSTLQLNQAITIPADRASVYLQGGQVKDYSNVDTYYPNCDFEVLTLTNKSRAVQPDEFIIKRVVQEEDIVASGFPKVASLIGVRFEGSVGLVDYKTIMYLGSAQQPDVYRITCAQWDEPMDAQHLTVRQIRDTLGSIFTLRLAR
jgi:hypothetical protein